MTNELFVFVNEIQQNLVFADRFSDNYTKTVTLSDGSTRTITLTATTRDGKPGVRFDLDGNTSWMGRNSTNTKGNLMVQLSDHETMKIAEALRSLSVLGGPTMIHWDLSLVGHLSGAARFGTGVELVNDNRTPMDFVVTALKQHLGLEQQAAVHTMLAVHTTGGAIVALPREMDAAAIAEAIVAEARGLGYPLVCRSLDA